MWDDVFGEPEGVRSADWAWRCSYKCFKSTRYCAHNIFMPTEQPKLKLNWK